MMRIGLVALAILGIAGPAHADSWLVGNDDDPFHEPRTEIGFGMLVGGYSVGPVGGAGVGLHLDVGQQIGPLKIFGEYNMLSVGEAYTEEEPVRGLLHRGGLNARYNVAEVGGHTRKVQGAFWLEAGAGYQRVQWNEGGRLDRKDLGLGFGAQLSFLIGRHTDSPKVLGFYYAFKALVARSPDADKTAMATCGGPCDEPTGPSPYDLGLFFNLGINWGR